jgi:hypothetical protein
MLAHVLVQSAPPSTDSAQVLGNRDNHAGEATRAVDAADVAPEIGTSASAFDNDSETSDSSSDDGGGSSPPTPQLAAGARRYPRRVPAPAAQRQADASAQFLASMRAHFEQVAAAADMTCTNAVPYVSLLAVAPYTSCPQHSAQHLMLSAASVAISWHRWMPLSWLWRRLRQQRQGAASSCPPPPRRHLLLLARRPLAYLVRRWNVWSKFHGCVSSSVGRLLRWVHMQRLHVVHMQARKQQRQSACHATIRRPSGCPAGGRPWCHTCRHRAGVCPSLHALM